MAAVNLASAAVQVSFTVPSSEFELKAGLQHSFGGSGANPPWRLDEVAGGGFVLNRYYSAAYNALGGGTVTNEDLRSLWRNLARLVG